MNCERIGNLIYRLRKERNMTQKQVADLMNISDKAISKWERGLGCPDVSLLPDLAEIFDVSVDGILSGDLNMNELAVGNMNTLNFYVCPQCNNLVTVLTEQNGYFDLEDTKQKEQQFMVISNSGFPGDNNFDTLKEVFKYCNPVLEIYRNCGKLLKSDDKDIEIVIKDYLKYVKDAGYEIVTKNSVSKDTMANLNKELMPLTEYVKFLGM